MRYYITLFLILLGWIIHAQEGYSSLTDKALETMWEAEDEAGYQKALDMYEEAFKIYPDSIDGTGLYKASVLASELKDYDKAFYYLTPLAAMEFDEDGYPGWSFVVGEYAESEYENLLSDPRWEDLKEKATKDKERFFDELKKQESEFYKSKPISLSKEEKGKTLYKNIRNHHPYFSKAQRDYSISFDINDTLKTSFFIHLPKEYNPEKSYSLLFILHGAVFHNSFSDYQIASENLGGWNKFYTEYADANEVILALPKGSAQYNWMSPDDGFFMVPEMLKLIKKAIHIDDNKVFISGHSNGATGSFSYLMKQPTPFAGFYGFNTQPKVFTGGTFIENIKNHSFINFSTDEDYYYPPNANDDFTSLMKEIKGDYQEFRYNGFPHWFPAFDESKPAYQVLFDDLNSRKRNPFPKEISWEFDDDNYGQVDWLSNIKLDTLQSTANWHKELNFKIDKWLVYDENDSLVVKDVDRNAFDFPRKSGKIKATYSDNTFEIETSRIGSFSIRISPEMVDLNKKVKVFVNGKLYFHKKVDYRTEYMLECFEENRDRVQVWVNKIDVGI